jgi:hypothetical protein
MRELGYPPADVALTLVAHAQGGSLWRAGRLYVLKTRGSAFERGHQHGVLLRQEIHDGVAPLLALRAFDLPQIRDAELAAQKSLRGLVEQVFLSIEADVSRSLVEELRGMAEGSGLAYETLFRASFLSEALQILASFGTGKEEAVANGACTAAVLTGPRTEAGGSLHGKNQDYDGGGLWDRFPLVHMALPDEGKAFACATSAGLLKGNLSINDAGVTIGGHFLFSSRVRRSGPGFTSLERDVASGAGSAEEAIEILKQRACLGAFAFVVTDRSGAAFVAECDETGVDVRPAQNDWLGMSNLLSTGAERDLLRLWGAHRNPISRLQRINDLGETQAGAAQACHIAAMLADRWDPASRTSRHAAHCVAHATTVTSAIADTGRAEFWVGEETCPASIGRFIGFSLGEAFNGGDPRIVGAIDTSLPDGVRGLSAFRTYLAGRASFRSGDQDSALAQVNAAATLDPDEPTYARIAARLYLRRQQSTQAISELVRVATVAQGRNEEAERLLLLGYAYDLLGDRAAALKHYQEIETLASETPRDALSWINPRIARAAAQAAQQPFNLAQAQKLEVPFDLTSGAE